ncbi:hypothetical protein KIW84_025032 [Lathyrus oleraceus]|uniref:Uncharacterized protein n=1 Tax=Pisum sativum TaxID=3888 RepID=A0A9D4YID5_PEA|nr:hypothetical protein KIW84_025032 [Pisum sativum]
MLHQLWKIPFLLMHIILRKKHGHPNINLPQSSSSNAIESQSSASEVNQKETTNVGLTQERYHQLMNLLQQESLIPSAGHVIGLSTNQLHTSIYAHVDHSSDEPLQSGIPSVITLSVSQNNTV